MPCPSFRMFTSPRRGAGPLRLLLGMLVACLLAELVPPAPAFAAERAFTIRSQQVTPCNVNADDWVHTVTLRFHTADEEGAGTNDTVTFELYHKFAGDRKFTWQLNGGGGVFDQGATDTFTFTPLPQVMRGSEIGVINISKPKSLPLEGSAWKLAWFEVEVNSKLLAHWQVDEWFDDYLIDQDATTPESRTLHWDAATSFATTYSIQDNPPVASDVTLVIPANMTSRIVVPVYDADAAGNKSIASGSGIIAETVDTSIVDAPAVGTITGAPPDDARYKNAYSYTPPPGFTGQVTFTYQAKDVLGKYNSDPAGTDGCRSGVATVTLVVQDFGTPAELTEQTMNITCTSTGQLCEPSFSQSFATTAALSAQLVVPPTACSSLRFHLYLGEASRHPATVGPGQSTGLVDFGPLPPGAYTLRVQAEGVSGGCNSGSLTGWSATLRVITNPPPAISAITPSMLPQGQAGQTLQVTGEHFTQGAVIRWNGRDLQTQYVSATVLTAALSEADVAVAGMRQVTVFTPPGGVSAPSAVAVGQIQASNVLIRCTDYYEYCEPAYTANVATGGLLAARFTPSSNNCVPIMDFYVSLDGGPLQRSSTSLTRPAQILPPVVVSPGAHTIAISAGGTNPLSPSCAAGLTLWTGTLEVLTGEGSTVPAMTLDGTVDTIMPVSVTCGSSGGLLCPTVFSTQVPTRGMLRVTFSSNFNSSLPCQLGRLYFRVDGVLKATATLSSDNGFIVGIDLGPVSPGTHTLGLQGEGAAVYCETGTLGQWSGTLGVDTVGIATGTAETDGNRVTYSITATDMTGIASGPTCSPASGSAFALGLTMVTCTATNTVGGTGTFTFGVQLRDTSPPVVSLPPNQVVPPAGPYGAFVTYPAATATDNVGVTSGPVCAPASGSLFALGTTAVTCTTSDAAGNTGTNSFTVSVRPTVSTQAPTCTLPWTSESPLSVWGGRDTVIDVLGYCSQANGNTIGIVSGSVRVVAFDSQEHTLTLGNGNSLDHRLYYRPARAYRGQALLQYRVTDGVNTSLIYEVWVYVENTPPSTNELFRGQDVGSVNFYEVVQPQGERGDSGEWVVWDVDRDALSIVPGSVAVSRVDYAYPGNPPTGAPPPGITKADAASPTAVRVELDPCIGDAWVTITFAATDGLATVQGRFHIYAKPTGPPCSFGPPVITSFAGNMPYYDEVEQSGGSLEGPYLVLSQDEGLYRGEASIRGINFGFEGTLYWNGVPCPSNWVDGAVCIASVGPTEASLVLFIPATQTPFPDVGVISINVPPALDDFGRVIAGSGGWSNIWQVGIVRLGGINDAFNQSRAVHPGATATVSASPTQVGQAGVSATLTNGTGGSGNATVTVAAYQGNPTGAPAFDAAGYVDVMVRGAAPGSSLTSRFYYPSTVTGAAETNLTLKYFTGTAWAAVRSSGTAPAKDTTDNLDSTVSGGRFSVTFDETSTPKLSQLTGTVFAFAPTDKQSQTITFSPLPGKTYADADFSVSATASSGLAVSFTANGNCTVTGSTVHLTGAGNCTITAHQAGNDSYTPAEDVTQVFTIVKAGSTTTVTCPAAVTYTGAPLEPCTASYTTSEGLGGSLTVSYQNSTNAGTATATASYAGDANHQESADSKTFVIAKAGQSITFGPLAGKTYGDADFTLAATASSGLAVSFGASGTCTVSGTTVHITGAGSCTVTAAQAGDGNFEAAPDVARTFAIAQAAVTVTVSVADAVYDGAPHGATATVTGPGGLNQPLPVSYAERSGTVYPVSATPPASAGEYTASASFSGDSNYLSGSAGRDFSITRAAASITIDAATLSQTYGAVTAVAATTVPAGLSYTVTYNGSATPPANAGEYTVTATITDADYQGSATATLTIARAAQAIALSAPASATYGSTFTVTVMSSGASGTPVLFTSGGGCTNSGASFTMTSGTTACSVIADQAGNDNYAAAPQVIVTVEAIKLNQTVTLTVPDAAVYGTSFSFTASASSGLPVSLAVTGGCSLSGASVTMTSGSDACTVTASQGGNGNYAAAEPVTNLVAAQKAAQSIGFGTLADKTYGDADFMVSATGGGSGNPVFFTATGSCSISGVTVHLTGAGRCTIAASQAGDSNYLAAPEVAQGFTVSKAGSATTVTCPSTAFTYTGAALEPCTASYTTSDGLSGSLMVSYQNNTSAGIATAAAGYAGDANHEASGGSTTFTIGKASSSVSVTCPDAALTYDGAPKTPCTATVTGAGGLEQIVVVTYTNNVNAGTASASASYAGDANHEASSGSASFTISKATSTTTVTCPASVTYTGTAQTPCGARVTGAGGLEQQLTVSYSNNTNAGTATATAGYTGEVNHEGSSASATFTIAKATPVLTWSAPADIVYGMALGSAQLDAAANVPGSFTYAPPAGTLLNAGSEQALSVSFSPDDAANYTEAGVTVSITVLKASQTISWADPADFVYGTALGAAQLNAKAAGVPGGSAPGELTYSPPAGIVLNAGNGQTLTATAAATSNYHEATKTVHINVLKAAQAITLAVPTSAVFGTSFTATASASSGLPVTLAVAGGCSLAGNTVTMTSGSEACTVTASQGGNENYLTAPPVSKTVTAQKARQTITATVPPYAEAGKVITLTAEASSGLPVSVTTSGPCSTDAAGKVTAGPDTGHCTVTISQTGNGNYSAATPVSRGVLVYAGVGAGGGFVIGDQSASSGVGTKVTFWGAQWAKDNTLSGGAAPSAFKGYANTVTPTGWTAHVGKDSRPPERVPSYMAVVVTSAVSKNGQEVSGTVTRIVIIQTDAGYSNDPGHSGRGTIVALLP